MSRTRRSVLLLHDVSNVAARAKASVIIRWIDANFINGHIAELQPLPHPLLAPTFRLTCWRHPSDQIFGGDLGPMTGTGGSNGSGAPTVSATRLEPDGGWIHSCPDQLGGA